MYNARIYISFVGQKIKCFYFMTAFSFGFFFIGFSSDNVTVVVALSVLIANHIY